MIDTAGNDAVLKCHQLLVTKKTFFVLSYFFLSPRYMIYFRENRERIEKEHQSLSFKDLLKVIGNSWAALTDDERKVKELGNINSVK